MELLKSGIISYMSGQLFNLRKRLLDLRKQTSLYQEETAELLDLPYKTYQAIEGGRRTAVRLDTLEKIAFGYGFDLWELFYPELPAFSEEINARIIRIMRHRGISRK